MGGSCGRSRQLDVRQMMNNVSGVAAFPSCFVVVKRDIKERVQSFGWINSPSAKTGAAKVGAVCVLAKG